MNDVLLTFLGIIFGLVLLAKLPVALGYLLNAIGIKPDMRSHIDEVEKQNFEKERLKYEKEAMPDIYEVSQRFGR